MRNKRSCQVTWCFFGVGLEFGGALFVLWEVVVAEMWSDSVTLAQKVACKRP